MEYEFTDEQWQKIKKYLPKVKPVDRIKIFVHSNYLLDNEDRLKWRTLPPCFGKWQEVYQCFSRWTKEGVFEDIFKEVTRVADTSEISIDSTFVKVHQHALSG